MNDIELIYEKVKDKYDLLLTNTFSLNEGFTGDFPVICGETEQGKFRLYADDLDSDPHGYAFVFSVRYEKRTLFRKRIVKRYTHWHPQTIEEAIKDIDEFMSGKFSLTKGMFCSQNRVEVNNACENKVF